MAIVQISKIQVRIGKVEDLPVLGPGEFGYATDTKQLYIGTEDGVLPDDNTEILTNLSPIPVIGEHGDIIFNEYGSLKSSSNLKYFSIPVPNIFKVNATLDLTGSLRIIGSSDSAMLSFDDSNNELFVTKNVSISSNTNIKLKITSLGVDTNLISSLATDETALQKIAIKGTTVSLHAGSSSDSEALVVNEDKSVNINGSFTAISKSFLIPHPNKPDMKLQYGSLEGPEHGVYIRGKCNTFYIKLPDYWENLVDINTITVQLTPIGKFQQLYVERIANNTVYILAENISSVSEINCYYTIHAERKDIDKLRVEFDA